MRRLATGPVILASLIASVSVTLMLLSIITQSWYLVDTVDEYGDGMTSVIFETANRYGLLQVEMFARYTESPDTVWEDTIIHRYDLRDGDEVTLSDHEQVARITLFLMIAGVVSSSLFIAFSIAYRRGMFDGDERAWRYVPVIIGSIGVVLIVLAISYFIIAFPGTVTIQGSNMEVDSQDSSVGFSYILAVVATIPILISVILMYRTINSCSRSPVD